MVHKKEIDLRNWAVINEIAEKKNLKNIFSWLKLSYEQIITEGKHSSICLRRIGLSNCKIKRWGFRRNSLLCTHH